MHDIITVGSANLDVLVKTKSETLKHREHFDLCYHLGEKVLVSRVLSFTGGGGTNTAVAFSRLGLKTAFIGCLGGDVNGKIIMQELKKEKVLFLGKIKKGETGYSIILPGRGDRTILVCKGINDRLKFSDINLTKLKTCWLYISTMLGESFKATEKLASFASKKGIKIAFNPSIYLARQTSELSSFLKKVDILILNREEAEALSKRKEIKDTLRTLEKAIKSAGIVVVTAGNKDIYAINKNKIYVKKIKPIIPVDSTGAGDAFASGFVYGIIRKKSIKKALDYGHKNAISVLSHLGAKNNLLRRL